MKRILAILTVVLLMTGCGKERHHDFWDSEYGDSKVGYFAFSLGWDEADDALSPIDNVHITVVGKDGEVIKQFAYTSPEDAADQLQQFPEGSCKLLVTVDMAEKDGYIVSQASTSQGGALPDTKVSLSNPSSSPHQAWYGVIDAKIKGDEITIVKFDLKRLMPTISIVVSDVPDGVSMQATITNAAQYVNLANSTCSTETIDGVSLGQLASDPSAPGTLRIDDRTIMPTANGQERAIITIATTRNGVTSYSTVDAPIMEQGRHYVLNIKYDDITEYIHISGTDVNAWQQDWTVDGEILNPDN